jgi:Fe-S cluster assembly protein SufD
MVTTEEKNATWLEQFEAFDRRNAAPAWLRKQRQEGFARFWELGFPTVHDEDWRYTSVAPIAGTPFELARPRPEIGEEDLAAFRIPGLACQLVFVNGRFAPRLSRFRNLPQGVVVGGLARALASAGGADAGLLESMLSHAPAGGDAFAALNSAFLEDGALVRIPRGVILESPVGVLYVSAGDGAPSMTHPRNLIMAEDAAQAAVVEDYVSLGGGVFFTNVITELFAGDSAVVEHYRIERENHQACQVSTLQARLGRSANVALHSVLAGGALVRNNVHPALTGEGGECLINGLFIGAGRQHLDNYMKVEHQAPHCSSRQFYNGILDGQAHGVFHGRIIVHPGAQKTDAKQTNRNLLLSDDARIDTKPQLEIYADDVKCTHGATIGQIEEDALFYLRSRGVPEDEARALLLFAFAHESLGRMRPGAVREWLANSISAWLPRNSIQEVG